MTQKSKGIHPSGAVKVRGKVTELRVKMKKKRSEKVLKKCVLHYLARLAISSARTSFSGSASIAWKINK
jgi:hypothetical protein